MHDLLRVAGKPLGSAFRAVFCQYRPRLRTKPSWASTSGVFAALLIAFGNTDIALAQQITGDIGFGGLFKPANNSFATTSLATATSIDFNGNGIQDVALAPVILATGDFAANGVVAGGTSAVLSDFIFNPFPSEGVHPLWSVLGSTFSFALDSISIDTQNANTLSLVGTGTISGIGFDATPGTWNFSGNPVGTSYFVFSAGGSNGGSNTGSVAAIPEPEIYAMMGAGLGLIGWIGRRKKSDRSAAA